MTLTLAVFLLVYAWAANRIATLPVSPPGWLALLYGR
jgi:hypothetical protein